jgi:hypothetical protein
MFASFAHGHKVCSSILNYAFDGTNTIPLINIPKWDFDWQGFYTYPKLVKVPAGYTLHSKHTYDNTTNNVNNPFNPPQVISAGTSTYNEMLYDAFQFMPYQTGDEDIDIESLFAGDSLLFPLAVNNYSAPTVGRVSAYPNPFNNKVRIGYELSSSSDVSVSIYNIYGALVRTISNQFEVEGNYTIDWNGKNDSGSNVPDGIYFYTISTRKSETSGKIVLMSK